MKSKTTTPHRVKMPDGTRIERKYRTGASGDREPFGSWRWIAYDPRRVPSRKAVNLHTHDQAAAYGKALKLCQRYGSGSYDPWADGSGAEALTVRAAVERFLGLKAKAGLAAATVQTYRVHLEGLAATLAPGALVRSLEARHVEAFLSRPKPDGSPRSGGTRNRIRSNVRPFTAWCVEAGLATEDAGANAKPGKAAPVRRHHVTPRETAAILRAIRAAEVLSGEPRAWLRDWIEFGAGSGLRPGEASQLTWGAVRLDERALEVGHVGTVKTRGSRRPVPLRGAALEVIRRLYAARLDERDDRPVFLGAGGGPINVRYVSKCLQRFATEAGVKRNVTAYSLRHAYGTQLVSEGVPIYDVARLMGTSVAMVETHYAHHDPARGAAHVERVLGGRLAGGPRRARLVRRRSRGNTMGANGRTGAQIGAEAGAPNCP